MKKLKVAKTLLPALMVLSWLTIPLLGKKAIKRFLPASLMMAIIVWLEGKIARKRKWWWYYVKVHPKLPGGFPLTRGTIFDRICLDFAVNFWEVQVVSYA